VTPPVGRRPGKSDTREEIIEAARRLFAHEGYERTSLRAVAREAAVDAALVHHYFDGKADLFMAAMAIPFDPRAVKHVAAGAATGFSGSRTVEGFLTMWDQAEQTESAFVSCISAMAASSDVADSIREFLTERVWSSIDRVEGEADEVFERRYSLVCSQLMGLAFARYVLRVPPVATASPREIAQWAGPTLERYVSGDVGAGSISPSAAAAPQ